MTELKQNRHISYLIDPVIYGDVFDYPLSIHDIERFCQQPMSASQLTQEILESAACARIVDLRDKLYFLHGREELVDLRRRREEISRTGWKVARIVAGVIRFTPFVRGILVTGSLAVDNCLHRDDIDFMILTESRRLWFVFALLGTLQRIVSRRYLCPNYYLTIDNLRLSRQSFYVAREAVQARPIFGAEACRRFWQENDWTTSYFPNAVHALPAPGGVMERRLPVCLFTKLVEWLFNGRIGDRVERLLKKLLRHRLTKHYGRYGQTVPDQVACNAENEVELRFHGLGHQETIDEALQRRHQQVEEILVAAGMDKDRVS